MFNLTNLTENQKAQLLSALEKHLFELGVKEVNGLDLDNIGDWFEKETVWYSYETDKGKLRTGYKRFSAFAHFDCLEDITFLED